LGILMANTPNMNLDLPDVGSTAGPEYASKNNDAFTELDGHDHTSGKGVRVPVAGLNINDDLAIQGNNLDTVRGVRFNSQVSEPTGISDIRIIYSKNDELFYRDAVGQEVQITNNGSVAGATGTISGLVSPAAATYSSVAGSFTVTKDSNETAKFDVSDLTIREFDVANANGITLKTITGLSSSFAWTLPGTQSSDASFEMVGIDSNGQLKYGSVVATANQTTVIKGTGGYTIGAAQDIATTSSPTFNDLTVSSDGIVIDPSSANIDIGEAFGGLNILLDNVETLSLRASSATIRSDQLRTEDGAAGSPVYSFINDTNTGMYRDAADTLGFSVGGARKLRVQSTLISGDVPFSALVGSVGSPSYTFSGDSNTGIYSESNGNISFSTNGGKRLAIGTTLIISQEPIAGPVDPSAPSFTFSADTTVGMGYNSSISAVDIWTGPGISYRFNSARFFPGGDNSKDLGGPSNRWDDVWATNGTIQTSDLNSKNSILDSSLGLSFISSLRPVEYKWNGGTRLHQGLIAQEVKAVLDGLGVDFAGYIDPGDGNGFKGLRYQEFIAPLIKAIQELTLRVEDLEAT
jgi:hypothetical protein